jgi:hypothetical protein
LYYLHSAAWAATTTVSEPALTQVFKKEIEVPTSDSSFYGSQALEGSRAPISFWGPVKGKGYFLHQALWQPFIHSFICSLVPCHKYLSSKTVWKHS